MPFRSTSISQVDYILHARRIYTLLLKRRPYGLTWSQISNQFWNALKTSKLSRRDLKIIVVDMATNNAIKEAQNHTGYRYTIDDDCIQAATFYFNELIRTDAGKIQKRVPQRVVEEVEDIIDFKSTNKSGELPEGLEGDWYTNTSKKKGDL